MSGACYQVKTNPPEDTFNRKILIAKIKCENKVNNILANEPVITFTTADV